MERTPQSRVFASVSCVCRLCCVLTHADERLEEWTITRLWFAGRFFDSPEELLDAWKSDQRGLRSNFIWEFPEGDETLYSTFKKRPGKKRGADQPVGSIPWEPYGRRYA